MSYNEQGSSRLASRSNEPRSTGQRANCLENATYIVKLKEVSSVWVTRSLTSAPRKTPFSQTKKLFEESLVTNIQPLNPCYRPGRAQPHQYVQAKPRHDLKSWPERSIEMQMMCMELELGLASIGLGYYILSARFQLEARRRKYNILMA